MNASVSALRTSAINSLPNVAVRQNGECFISVEELACEVSKEYPVVTQEDYDTLVSIAADVVRAFYQQVGR